MMKRLLTCLTLLASPALVLAQENFMSNPVAPYPPGCATNTEAMGEIPGREVVITSGTLQFAGFSGETNNTAAGFLDVEMALVRRGCAEPDRSLLIVELTVLDNGNGVKESTMLPAFQADRFGVIHRLRGVAEPNSWSAHSTGEWLGEGQSIRLFLDGPSLFDPELDPQAVLSPAEYNDDWELLIIDPAQLNAYRVDVPEYRNQLQADSYVINGRLSGIWWIPETPDQGVFLGFHERANDDSGVAFLSWNTFGPNGENLWFSGSGDYQVGDEEVQITIVWVDDGEFMGSRRATRAIAGTVTVNANSCNDLTMTYQMTFPGLDSGTRQLVRPFALETQGYTCRDRDARVDSL